MPREWCPQRNARSHADVRSRVSATGGTPRLTNTRRAIWLTFEATDAHGQGLRCLHVPLRCRVCLSAILQLSCVLTHWDSIINDGDGVLVGSPEEFEPKETLADLQRWYGKTSRELYLVGPLLPTVKNDSAVERSIADKAQEIVDFMDRMHEERGPDSIIYVCSTSIQFATVDDRAVSLDVLWLHFLAGQPRQGVDFPRHTYRAQDTIREHLCPCCVLYMC